MFKLSRYFITIVLFCNNLVAQVMLPKENGDGNFVNLNGMWDFSYYPTLNNSLDSVFYKKTFSTESWSKIRVPGSWETQGFAEPNYGSSLKEGTGYYRTTFQVPASWNSQSVFISFDGVCFGYDFWINGFYVGSFSSAFTRQTFDIGKYLKKNDKNILAVKVSTRVKGWEFDTNDDWSLSGICRDVKLFCLPEIHFDDLTIKTKLIDSDAMLLISGVIMCKNSDALNVSSYIKDAKGEVIADINIGKFKRINDEKLIFIDSVLIKKPKLWNAENPYLYKLTFRINKGEKNIQEQIINVGIREISLTDGIFKLNGQPIKLRGITHHELSLTNGRYMTNDEIIKDIDLIKKANINFIRTSHYPASKYLVDLCDSVGIYLMEEIPFGYGDNHLNDTSYQQNLYTRALTTIKRDKNAPSIIIWSIGNENKITEIGLNTGRYVQQLDDTRPYCYPTVGSYFKTVKDNYPAEVPVLSPHYPSAKIIKEYSTQLNKPLLFSEYAHAFGLEFDKIETVWDEMYSNSKVAGGAIWHFFDQGVIKKSLVKPDTNKYTTYVWLDSLTYVDHSGDKGPDGIVYADRTPQVDYWQVRKVYSPVNLLNEVIEINSQKRNSVVLRTLNKYDFTNLSDVTMEWELFHNKRLIQKGGKKMNATPHQVEETNILLNIEDGDYSGVYYLITKFKDLKGEQFYEKSIPVEIKNQSKYNKLLSNIISGNNSKIQVDSSGLINILFSDSRANLSINPLLRIGRKKSLASEFGSDKTSEDSLNIRNDKLYSQHILYPSLSKCVSKNNNSESIQFVYRKNNDSSQYISGLVNYNYQINGTIEVSYEFIPHNLKGILLESGIAFQFPKALSEYRWVGKGPYPSYPGKSALSTFGFYHLNSEDINFQGNFSEVDIALITNKEGQGLMLVGDKSNISLEKNESGILFGHNAIVSGRYSKKGSPEIKFDIEKVKKIEGSFKIIPISMKWSDYLINFFGSNKEMVVPFKPFYHSYDQ